MRRSARRNGYYFFFAVFRTERLRAGAAFLARFLVDFFFIAIMGLLSLWSCVTANQRRHVLSTTLIRLTNLYRAPKFQRKDGLRRSGCGAAGAADSTDARVRSISGRARRFVPLRQARGVARPPPVYSLMTG